MESAKKANDSTDKEPASDRDSQSRWRGGSSSAEIADPI